jgi:DNA-binding transcriptional ArsR family regulator
VLPRRPVSHAEPGQLTVAAPIFAALGDRTRLGLVARLASGERLSITQLTQSTGLTRQAVTRHLEVLAAAGIIRGTWEGREHIWQLEVARLALARRSLEQIAQWWDDKLDELKAAVEEK